jgi:hypothetical protein
MKQQLVNKDKMYEASEKGIVDTKATTLELK